MWQLPERIIRLGFYLLYHQFAFTYDLVAWLVSLGQWADWRRTALRHLQPGPTLELAYGTGGLFVDLHEAGLKPLGLDLSPYMARLTRSRLRRRGLSLRIAQADARHMPYPADHFVNMIATFPTPYIFEPATLHEVCRVLQPGGCLIIVLQGQLEGTTWLLRFIEYLYHLTGQRGFLETDPLQVFAAAGLEAAWHVEDLPGSQALLIVAQKPARNGAC